MEKKSLKEKEAKLLGGLLHTQVDQIFIWRTTFYFLFGGLLFNFHLEDYFLPFFLELPPHCSFLKESSMSRHRMISLADFITIIFVDPYQNLLLVGGADRKKIRG